MSGLSKLGELFASLGWQKIHDGFCKVWKTPPADGCISFEVVEATDSVGLLVYNKTDRSLVFVSQDRPAMIRSDNSKGEIIEVLAGRFDVEIGARGLMVKEAREELGLTIHEEEVRLLNGGFPLALSSGILTEKMYLGYVEVTADRFSAGDTFGSDPGEVTKRINIPIDLLESWPVGNMQTWALIQWFIAHKVRR